MNVLYKGLAAAAVAVSLAGTAAAEEKTISFGIISTESTQALKSQWDPFLAAMAEQTGYQVEAFFASDYAGVIEAMRFGKVQVAWFGNKSAMEAVDRADGEVFVQTVDVDGNPGYWSVLITQAASPLNSVEDVLACDKTLDFGMGDPNSTSGFLVPTTFIFAAEGVDPARCFKTVRNANHEANALAVANGQVDVATNNTENMLRIKENNPEAYAKIKEIWRSPLIPADPIVWRKDLDAATKRDLYFFFLSYGRLGTADEVAAAREVLAGLKWAPFRPSSDAQLYPIRIMEITKSELKVQGDATLSEAEKQAKLAELAAQKKQIEEQMALAPQK